MLQISTQYTRKKYILIIPAIHRISNSKINTLTKTKTVIRLDSTDTMLHSTKDVQ